jgi:hypothetical protein
MGLNSPVPSAIRRAAKPRSASLPELTDAEHARFLNLLNIDLTAAQRRQIAEPPFVVDSDHPVLAVHWHPEHVPLELIRQRVDAMYPRRAEELVIPTEHNELTEFDGYAGVEIDCYSPEIGQKVQLLAHFRRERLERADAFRALLAHTLRHRAAQLSEFIDSAVQPAHNDRMRLAAARSGANEELVSLVRHSMARLRLLLDAHESQMSDTHKKNKLVRSYFDALADELPAGALPAAQALLTALKDIVKECFSTRHFYRTQDVIAEVRALGGGLVIPHPEQFWPILLAGYDVDGIEVWNPQSRRYTELLVRWVHHENLARCNDRPKLLVFMGDDTHFGEKLRDPPCRDAEKAGRELGVQPAWNDHVVRVALRDTGVGRAGVIREYRQRLQG